MWKLHSLRKKDEKIIDQEKVGGALFEFFVKKDFNAKPLFWIALNSSHSFKNGEKIFEEHLRSRIEPEKWLIVQNE